MFRKVYYLTSFQGVNQGDQEPSNESPSPRQETSQPTDLKENRTLFREKGTRVPLALIKSPQTTRTGIYPWS